MNKTAIKNYAVWARVQLIEAVKQRAFEYEITESGEYNANLDSINGRVLTAEEKEQRSRLIELIKQKGYEQVMEEAAYTWFNRFIALRFMEVNGYLPSKTRVFTDENNQFKPEILKQAMTVELDGLDREKVIDLVEKQKNEELYKYLLITQCNALNAALPDMFEKISNWTELLFPNNLLKADSVIERMLSIPEEDWTDQVEIIGWLYQYYNDERKNQVINIQKSIIKKEDIPAATQLFTTDWVVRYIVDNSLGRYWIERNPESTLAEKLDYFVLPKSGIINYIDEKVDPTEIKVFDPCMGSAHFLVYAFDVLMAIYVERGYSERDAAILIAEKNLYGLEIDKRAYQLSYFALMMKARNHNRRILRNKGLDLNVAYIRPTDYNTDFINLYSGANQAIVEKVLNDFKYGDELGSIIQPSFTLDELAIVKEETSTILENYYDNFFDTVRQSMIRTDFVSVLKQAEILAGKYDIVATNPPFMNKMDKNLKNYVNAHYKNYSSDLFSVFIYRNFAFCKQNGYSGFMSPYVWMFIKSYEKLREHILTNKSIVSLIQMEYSAFEEATVPICTFVMKNARSKDKGFYFRLTDFKGGMKVQGDKVLEAIANHECGYFYEADSDNFSKIPGSPIAYWVSENAFMGFDKSELFEAYAKTRAGMITGDNNRFVRLWFEIENNKMGVRIKSRQDSVDSRKKWFPYNKGGDFRKWYGNNEHVVNWENDGFCMRNYKDSAGKIPAHAFNLDYIFKENITWNALSSYKYSARYSDYGFLYDASGSFADVKTKDLYYILSFLCSSITAFYLSAINPTLNFQKGNIASLPLIFEESKHGTIDEVTKQNVTLSKSDWDSFETSWDFKKHPLV